MADESESAGNSGPAPAAANLLTRHPVAAAAVGICVLVLLMLGFAAWPVARGTIESALAPALRATGGSLSISGRTSFALLPTPHVTVGNAAFTYPAGSLSGRADSTRVGLALLPLLSGNFVPTELTFSQFDGAVVAPASAPVAALRDLAAAGGRDAPLGTVRQLRVRGGRLALPGTAAGEAGLADLNLVWHPPQAGENFDFALEGRWRDQPIRLAVSGPAGGGSAGSRAVAALTLATPLGSLEFSGHLLAGGQPKAEGQLTLSSQDGAALMQWLGLPRPLPGRFDRLELSGSLSGTDRQWALFGATFALNGDSYDGVLGLRLDGDRPALSATLAAETVDMTDQLQVLAPSRTPDGAWSQQGFDLSAMDGLDLDLRLSARQLRFAELMAERAALSILMRNGRLEISVAEATVAQGAGKGRLVIARNAAGGIDSRGQLQLEKADIGKVLEQAFGVHRLTGQGSVQVAYETSGRSSRELAEKLDGQIKLSVGPGTLVGVDLDRMLSRIERRSLLGALDIPAGQTSFDSVNFAASAQAGLISLSRCEVRSRTLSIDLSGTTAAPDQVLDFGGSVASLDRAGRATNLPFTIRGTWQVPRLRSRLDRIRFEP